MNTADPEMPQEEKRESFGEESEGASQVPSPMVVANELREDGDGENNPSLTELSQVMERLDGEVGRVGNLVQEVKDLRDAQGMEGMAPGGVEESLCPICGGEGIFGVNEKWLYLVFAVLGFLMGYIATVHGRG